MIFRRTHLDASSIEEDERTWSTPSGEDRAATFTYHVRQTNHLAGEHSLNDLYWELRRHIIDLTGKRDDDKIVVMCALELMTDVAYHDGSSYDLAVLLWAWRLCGYHDSSFGDGVSHTRFTHDVLEAALRGAYRRNRRKLADEADGLVTALMMLARADAITASGLSEARRQRWLARGGHDGGVRVTS